MRKVLRKREVCDKCKRLIFREEAIHICDACEKEITETDFNDGAFRYKTTIWFKKDSSKDRNLTYDFCNLECFIGGLRKIKNYAIDQIWGFSFTKEDIRKLLEMIK